MKNDWPRCERCWEQWGIEKAAKLQFVGQWLCGHHFHIASEKEGARRNMAVQAAKRKR